MKAERVKTEPEFVPVIVTLESQEEVDSLHAIGNHEKIGCALPALHCWYAQLAPFVSGDERRKWEKLNQAIR